MVLFSKTFLLAAASAVVLAACSGGGGGGTSGGSSGGSGGGGTGGGGGGGTPPPVQNDSDAFSTPQKTARFLSQSTFGPTPGEVEDLTGTDAVDWFLDELDKPVTLSLPMTQDLRRMVVLGDDFNGLFYHLSSSSAFWNTALEGDDQLRQRVAFALSEIFVVSAANFNELWTFPDSTAYFHDILKRNAFGNYRDLIEEVTYSPAMGFYLTYEGNQKADPTTGRVPDENYAREIMQLFSIGVVELNDDGTPAAGSPETYTNEDVTGLASVFTGLFIDDPAFVEGDVEGPNASFARPMSIDEQSHTSDEKAFLGALIPAGTGAAASIDQALDVIANHPNVGPFISRQLIQRLVMSNPEADYVERVANAFESGRYALPGGTQVGDGRRGDLAATVAAVLFDDDARSDPDLADNRTGKIREPIIRFANWTRAFEIEHATAEYMPALYFSASSDSLGQQAFRSPSVFNFFRPGYIAPGTESGEAGMTVPELQITNSSSLPGYVNFMSQFVFNSVADTHESEVQFLFDEGVEGYSVELTRQSFNPDYSEEMAMAEDIDALLDQLDLKLTYGQLSDPTRALITDAIDDITIVEGPDGDQARFFRVSIAVMMIMSSSDFLVVR